MPYSLKFFYLGYQCPHNTYLLARIKTIAWKELVPLHIFDVTKDAETCAEQRIFTPTTLLVNDKHRWLGPFSRETVLALLYDEEVPPIEPLRRQSNRVYEGELVSVDSNSVLSTCRPCLQSDDIGLCRGKCEWIESTLRGSGASHLGYLHFRDGECVGGAEYLPSLRIPYPIPDKREGNAFLTCLFKTNAELDFMSHPLKRLVQDLGRFGFDTLSVVASTDTAFPNGPCDWFERTGFEDRGLLSRESHPETELRYLQLPL